MAEPFSFVEHRTDNSSAFLNRDGGTELNHLPKKARNSAPETRTSNADSYLIDVVCSTIPIPVLLSGQQLQLPEF